MKYNPSEIWDNEKRGTMISKELFIIFIFASSAKACPSSSKATFKDYKGNIVIQSMLQHQHKKPTVDTYLIS